jgi:hypothetical protein
VKELIIELKCNPHSDWILFVSKLIDLTTIVRITLKGRSTYRTRRNMRINIARLLQRTPSLSYLNVDYDYYIYNSWTADNICFMVPSHVKHLTVAIKNMDEIRFVLNRLQHLSSAKFHFSCALDSRRIIEWLEKTNKGSRYRRDACSINVWLKKGTIQSKERKRGNKRIRLTDDHHNA